MGLQILDVKINRLACFAIVIMLLSCTASKKVVLDKSYHSEALSACIKYMLETDGVLVGKYPCGKGYILVNSNLYLHGTSSRNGLKKSFLLDQENRKQTKGFCIELDSIELVSNNPCKIELVDASIIDEDNVIYYRKYRMELEKDSSEKDALHTASPVLYDNVSKNRYIFLTINYLSDIISYRFTVERKRGKWVVVGHTDWWL